MRFALMVKKVSVSTLLSFLFQARAASSSIEPGASVSILFTVAMTTSATVGSSAVEALTVKSTNDRNYTLSSSSVTVAAGYGGATNGSVNMTVPAGATSGTDVTLTIEVQNAAGTDVNYAVLRFVVSAQVVLPASHPDHHLFPLSCDPSAIMKLPVLCSPGVSVSPGD